MLPDIAIGAIGAALIGALISLVGLIISKETKVSEFRQAWIDALRTELSDYLVSVNAVIDAKCLLFKTANERFDTLQTYFSNLNQAYYLIALRLNSDEILAKRLQACMLEISKLAKDKGNANEAEFEAARVNFIVVANQLLKDEWRRVKVGEPVYRVTRYFSGLIVLLLIFLSVLIVTMQKVETSATKKSQASEASDKAAVAKGATIPK